MAQDKPDLASGQAMAIPTGAAAGAVPVDVLRPATGPARRNPPHLLAVDCGLRTGLALFARDGQLLWYRSHHVANRTHLKRAVRQILGGLPGLRQLAVEGGGTLADVWLQEAARRGVPARRVHAEQWRTDLLLPRQQRTGRQAKKVAAELAREIIARAGGAKPTSLRHDAAEAILIGWWTLSAKPPAPGYPAGHRAEQFEKPPAGANIATSPNQDGEP
jgi:hypothetical protein